MTNVKTWSAVDAENVEVSPDGWPEGMARSGVNDSARAMMGALRIEYGAGEWTTVYVTTGDAWVASFNTATQVKLAPVDAQITDIKARFPTGCRVKIVTDTPSTQFGFISGQSFSTPNTLVDVTIDDGSSLDGGANMVLEIGLLRDQLEKTAYYPTGVTKLQTPPQVPTADDIGTVALLDNDGHGSLIDADLLDGQHAADIIATSSAAQSRNALYNGSFLIWQRGLTIGSSTADGRTHVNDNGNYCADRWKILSGNSTSGKDDVVDVSRDTTAPPTGIWANLRLTRTGTDVVAQDFAGIFQILDGKESAQFIGSTAVSIAADLKASAGITGARIMVLGWTGTEDSITFPDPISDWASAGGQPIFEAGWVEMIDSATIAVTGTWTRTEVENKDISAFATVKNVGILIYIDDASWAAAETLEISGVQMENAAASTPFAQRDYQAELGRCQRYFNHTFDEGVDPRNKVGEHTGLQWPTGNSPNGSTDALAMMYHFPTTMRTTPTVVVYNPVNDTDASFWEQRTPADILVSALAETITEKRVNWTFTGTTYDNRVIRGHGEADAEF